MVRIRIPALAILALLSLCAHANAQALCPEVMRLRSEAQAALKQSMAAPAPERCYRYNRQSEAWQDLARYASDNREACHVSISLLNDFERYRSEAVRDRDNVCAGRPLRRYGADIIQH